MAIDYENAIKERNGRLVELAQQAARDQYDAHIRQPGGLVHPFFQWKSGDNTTALVAYPTEREGTIRIRFPSILTEWHIVGQPSGSAVVNIMMAPHGTALSAATSLVTGFKPTLSSQEEVTNDSFAPVSVPAKARIFALLESVSTCRAVEVTLTLQRVPA